MKALFCQSLLLLVSLVESKRDPSTFLYNNVENVIEFYPADSEDGTPAQGDFRESMKPKMVEFYNPFCGACKAYMPTYLKIAEDLLAHLEKGSMEIYAVSCQVHDTLCSGYGIDGVPMVALFREGQQDPHFMKKLEHEEKNPDFILPYLFPGHGGMRVERGLAEAADSESGDEEKEEGGESAEDDDDEGGEEENNDEGENEDGGEGISDEENNNESEEGEEENANESEENGEEENENEDQSEEGNESQEEEAPNDDEENEGQESKSQEEEAPEVDGEIDLQAPNDDEENEGQESNEGPDAASEEENQNDDGLDQEQLEKDVEEAHKVFFESQNRQPGNIGKAEMPYSQMVRGAGAGMSREMEAEMEQWREAFKKEHDKRKSIFRREQPLGGENKRVKEEHFDGASGATKAMRAHMPGTMEYQMRQRKIQDHHEKVLRKQKLRTKPPEQRRFSAGAGGASRFEIPANHKPVVPYKKELKKQKLTHRLAGKVPGLKRLVALSKEEELILDASLSFMYILKHGLFNDPDPLNKHKKRALQNWLDLLRVSLPPEWALHEVIMDLDNNIETVAQSDANLQKFLHKHELPRHEWSHSCRARGGRPSHSSCGFWKLLHVISVGLAEHRGGLNLVEGNLVAQDARVFSPHQAAEAIKEFVGNFFPCKKCRNHFVAQYDECSNRRCVRLTEETDYASFKDWQEIGNWLWEVHNDVNVKVFKDKQKEKKMEVTIHDEIKVLYPSLDTCLGCFREDGGYDEDAIFVFLEREYWPGASDIDPTADKLLFFHDSEYEGFASSWAILFVAVGIIYMFRPKGVFHKRSKKRAD